MQSCHDLLPSRIESCGDVLNLLRACPGMLGSASAPRGGGGSSVVLGVSYVWDLDRVGRVAGARVGHGFCGRALSMVALMCLCDRRFSHRIEFWMSVWGCRFVPGIFLGDVLLFLKRCWLFSSILLRLFSRMLPRRCSKARQHQLRGCSPLYQQLLSGDHNGGILESLLRSC